MHFLHHNRATLNRTLAYTQIIRAFPDHGGARRGLGDSPRRASRALAWWQETIIMVVGNAAGAAIIGGIIQKGAAHPSWQEGSH
jgi:hypothetical protein